MLEKYDYLQSRSTKSGAGVILRVQLKKEDFAMSQRTAYRRTAMRGSNSILDSEIVQLLLFYILPFIIINSVIFFLVTVKPKYEVHVGETHDYRTTTVTFSIKSYLPLKEVTITLNSEPLDLVRTGKRTYQAVISTNGILDVYMKNFNGMSLSEYEVIDILDDGAPELVSYDVNEGILSLVVKDTQSGIDYASLHATTVSGQVVSPLSVDQANGLVTFQLDPSGLTVSIKDLSGNEYLPSFSVVKEASSDGVSSGEGQLMVQ